MKMVKGLLFMTFTDLPSTSVYDIMQGFVIITPPLIIFTFASAPKENARIRIKIAAIDLFININVLSKSYSGNTLTSISCTEFQSKCL